MINEYYHTGNRPRKVDGGLGFMVDLSYGILYGITAEWILQRRLLRV
jgi:hypothetical protein